jgi:ribosomal protein S18 acetylase RimI-like enzyme
MDTIVIRTGDAPDVDAFLAERIYEYNAAATGYHDAESYSAVRRDDAGQIVAGVSGFTWGGCCYVSYLWVAAALRGRGIGSELLRAAERHAREKRCRLMLLSSHEFQAPTFYTRLGFEAVARIEDYPAYHADIVLAKRLDRDTAEPPRDNGRKP